MSRRGYRFIGVPSATATTYSTGAREPAVALRTPVVVGRSRELARLRAAWDVACTGKRDVRLGRWRARYRQDDAHRPFVASLGDVASSRGQCVEHYGAGEPYLPILDALADLCRRDNSVLPLLRSVAPAWLLQLPWLGSPEQRDSAAERARRSTTRPHAPRNGRAAGSLHCRAAAVARDRRSALERRRDASSSSTTLHGDAETGA